MIPTYNRNRQSADCLFFLCSFEKPKLPFHEKQNPAYTITTAAEMNRLQGADGGAAPINKE